MFFRLRKNILIRNRKNENDCLTWAKWHSRQEQANPASLVTFQFLEQLNTLNTLNTAFSEVSLNTALSETFFKGPLTNQGRQSTGFHQIFFTFLIIATMRNPARGCLRRRWRRFSKKFSARDRCGCLGSCWPTGNSEASREDLAGEQHDRTRRPSTDTRRTLRLGFSLTRCSMLTIKSIGSRRAPGPLNFLSPIRPIMSFLIRPILDLYKKFPGCCNND